MQFPTTAEIEALHHKYAPNDAMFDWVYTHCQAVWSIAEQLIDEHSIPINKDLVRVGCLVHDIGVYTLFEDVNVMKTDAVYVTHGIRGEEILRSEGWDEVFQRFASHHTGVGITKEMIEAGHLPLPHQDYLADTVEERIVMYADKFHSKSTPLCFNSFEWYKQQAAKFGDDNIMNFNQLAAEFGVPNLKPLAKKYGHHIRE